MNKAFMSIFGSPHELHDSTQLAFGKRLISTTAERDWTLIARYPKQPKSGDGQEVEVYCSAMPAEFFLIKALEGRNSIGWLKDGFQLITGSGMAKLSAQIANAISEGMLGINTDIIPSRKEVKHASICKESNNGTPYLSGQG